MAVSTEISRRRENLSCLCGCGRAVGSKRSHQRYHSPACRVKAHRAQPVATIDSLPTGKAQGAPRRAKAVSHSRTDDVTLSDRPKAVYCSGSGLPMSRLEGPLPVAVYCKDCVTAQRCPCYGRPAWHRRAR